MMQYEEAIKYFEGKEFLDKLYGFAYRRCNTSHEAEELCSNIILSAITSIHKNPNIENFYAFIWTIAHRVYADFCKERKRQKEFQTLEAYVDSAANRQPTVIDELIERQEEDFNINKIMREITFLSKIYREAMILYYLDELKVSQIANKLSISETTVKQRLFSARNTIKKEMKKMEKSYTLKPVDIAFIGTGDPRGNDPRTKAERVFSKNLIYLCKNTPLSAKEISEKLNVPMPYIEEEIDIQLKGENGTYGLLRKLDNNKYTSNVIIVEGQEYNKALAIYQNVLDEFCTRLGKYLDKNEKKICNFPFLNKQSDIKFISWSLISRMIWCFEDVVTERLASKYFGEQTIVERDFSVIGLADTQDKSAFMKFYSCDGTSGQNLCGYSNVKLVNIHGERIKPHFWSSHNISNDEQILLTIKAINGMSIDTLSEDEKEIAAKAIESGYIQKKDNMLTPKILVMDSNDEDDFYNLSTNFKNEVEDLAEKVADNLAQLIKEIVPSHLLNEYPLFRMLTSTSLIHFCIERCIEKNILIVPEKPLGAEGTWMIVSK